MEADQKSEMERTVEITQQKEIRKEHGMKNRGGVTYEKTKRCKWMTGPKDMARAKYSTTLMTNTNTEMTTNTNTNTKLMTNTHTKFMTNTNTKCHFESG